MKSGLTLLNVETHFPTEQHGSILLLGSQSTTTHLQRTFQKKNHGFSLPPNSYTLIMPKGLLKTDLDSKTLDISKLTT